MGANGISIFDNDDATDWLDGYDSDGAAAVTTALETVTELDAQDYLEATEAAHALAAAEVVAASRDGDFDRIPEDAVDRVQANAAKLNAAKLIGPARRAVARVLKSSELKDEWEAGRDAEEWEDHVSELLERLKG
jgi:hypothetical protein